MITRKSYLQELNNWRDKDLIKVITGVRRCGKSTLLKQFQETLQKQGVPSSNIIALNLEDLAYEELHDYKKLYDYIQSKLQLQGKNYVFLDEIQLVPQFQKAVDSLYLNKNVDLYITGSNAYLLSGELATLLSGRYIEIKMLPFSFKEFFSFKGGNRQQVWQEYFAWGGFPYNTQLMGEEAHQLYLEGIYSTILVKDVSTRKATLNTELMDRIARFLFLNIGNIVSAKKIADTLTSQGMKTSSATVEEYIKALLEAFLFYKVGRYNIKGMHALSSLEKYYLVDTGLRRLFTTTANEDIGYILENIVYLELLRRNYFKVRIGKWDAMEIDFITEKAGVREYYQVSASLLDPKTLKRELAPLQKINDAYAKYILTLDTVNTDENGIRCLNVIDWLLNEK
jgi:predicted AAA+ superfamily ATPase